MHFKDADEHEFQLDCVMKDIATDEGFTLSTDWVKAGERWYVPAYAPLSIKLTWDQKYIITTMIEQDQQIGGPFDTLEAAMAAMILMAG